MLILVIMLCYYGEMLSNLFPKAEAIPQRCSVKKVLEISENLQENACARASFLVKLQACNFI